MIIRKTINSNFFRYFTTKVNQRPPVCYYKILNLTPNSTLEEIKKEYYRLAKKYHPDNSDESKVNQSVIFHNLRKNLKKYLRHMRYSQIFKKENNMIY